MRFVSLIMAVLICGGCTASGATRPNATFRELKSGAFAASSSPAPQMMLARDADSYRRIWGILIGSGEPPQVDFAHETAIFLLDRQRRTGGYSLEVTEVGVDGGTAVVKVVSRAPKSGSVTAQVLTTPFTVIAVSGAGISAARWVDAVSGAVVAETAKKP
jgi:hypothetical protein